LILEISQDSISNIFSYKLKNIPEKDLIFAKLYLIKGCRHLITLVDNEISETEFTSYFILDLSNCQG